MNVRLPATYQPDSIETQMEMEKLGKKYVEMVPKEEFDHLRSELTKAQLFLWEMLPIVEAAYYDELPGSGYNHKAQLLAGRQWGWQNSTPFREWVKLVKGVISKP